jgi:hypothetical protein
VLTSKSEGQQSTMEDAKHNRGVMNQQLSQTLENY